MSKPIQLRIRGTDTVRSKFRQACAKFDLEYGEMALNAAKFVMENEEQFRRFVYEEERSR